MNLIFSEKTCVPQTKCFAVPDHLDFFQQQRSPDATTTTAMPVKKREREDDCEGKQTDGREAFACVAAPTSHLTRASILASIQRDIEHGRGFMSGESNLLNEVEADDHLRRMSLLHLALSILCHVAAIDESGHFISAFESSRHARFNSGATTGGDGGSRKKNSTAARDDSVRSFFLTDIYTTVRAMKLEYEELLRQQRDQGSCKQQEDIELVSAAISAAEARIDASLYLLERTILRMILNFDYAKKIPVSYVSKVLNAIPQVFAMVRWPFTVLHQCQSPNPSPEEKDRHLKQVFNDGVACDDVSSAATAIVLKVMHTLKKGDCLQILCFRNNIGAARSLPDFSLLMSFEQMMTNALSGAYRWRGLYGALHDMRLLLYGLYSTMPAEQERILAEASKQFEELLRVHYSNFLRVIGLYDPDNGPLLPDRTIFDINPFPTDNNAASYTETQRKCLRLLDILRKADPNGWFEYPIFDMANIELGSVEKWVRSQSFGTKTNRDAFVALRDVLEQMVNNCVLSYGPTSQYSQVITLVRQRLVDASREVGLI